MIGVASVPIQIEIAAKLEIIASRLLKNSKQNISKTFKTKLKIPKEIMRNDKTVSVSVSTPKTAKAKSNPSSNRSSAHTKDSSVTVSVGAKNGPGPKGGNTSKLPKTQVANNVLPKDGPKSSGKQSSGHGSARSGGSSNSARPTVVSAVRGSGRPRGKGSVKESDSKIVSNRRVLFPEEKAKIVAKHRDASLSVLAPKMSTSLLKAVQSQGVPIAVPSHAVHHDRETMEGKHLCVEGTEILKEVVAAESDPSGTVLVRAKISPDMLAGSRSSSFARLYQKYRYKYLTFEYNSVVPATQTGGLVSAVFADPDTNVLDNEGADALRTMFSSKTAQTNQVWQDSYQTYHPPGSQDADGWYWCPRSNVDISVAQQRQEECGEYLLLLTTASEQAVTLGYVTVHYKVEFMYPESTGSDAFSTRFYASENLSTANPFGGLTEDCVELDRSDVPIRYEGATGRFYIEEPGHYIVTGNILTASPVGVIQDEGDSITLDNQIGSVNRLSGSGVTLCQEFDVHDTVDNWISWDINGSNPVTGPNNVFFIKVRNYVLPSALMLTISSLITQTSALRLEAEKAIKTAQHVSSRPNIRLLEEAAEKEQQDKDDEDEDLPEEDLE